MASIIPFKALRPQPQFASLVASRPYDVLNSEEARLEAQGNPNSFLHVTKSEIDLSSIKDIYAPEVYEKAHENLMAFIQRGVLFLEEKPCYYIYRLAMDSHEQTGLVCCSAVNDYEHNIIRKHELTRPDKEQDRINHIKATGAQTGNVFLTYKSVTELDGTIKKWAMSHEPVYDFTAHDGVKHTVWIVNDDKTISAISEMFQTKVPKTYIADGHHRAASAAKVRNALEDSKANYFLTTLFPANELRILDYNRVVRDIGMAADQFIKRVKIDFVVTHAAEPVQPSALHEFGMYLNQQWYHLQAREGTFDDDPIGVLDVSILSNNILSKILGIHDQRTDKRVDFVGGIRGVAELEKRVNDGDMEVAFTLYPVSIEQLIAIADQGEIMPPKSTWFEPKLRDGLLTHLIREL